jgi:hypothetical protein
MDAPNAVFDAFAAAASLTQTRLALLSKITSSVDVLFLDEPVEDEAAWQKMKAGTISCRTPAPSWPPSRT